MTESKQLLLQLNTRGAQLYEPAFLGTSSTTLSMALHSGKVAYEDYKTVNDAIADGWRLIGPPQQGNNQWHWWLEKTLDVSDGKPLASDIKSVSVCEAYQRDYDQQQAWAKEARQRTR